MSNSRLFKSRSALSALKWNLPQLSQPHTCLCLGPFKQGPHGNAAIPISHQPQGQTTHAGMERDRRASSLSQSHGLASTDTLAQDPLIRWCGKEKCYFTFLDSGKLACCQNHQCGTAPASSCHRRCSTATVRCAVQDCMVAFGEAMMMGFNGSPKLLLWGLKLRRRNLLVMFKDMH